MNYLSNSRSTKELQNIDLNHHFHPFTSTSDIKDGARIIKEGKGIYLWDVIAGAAIVESSGGVAEISNQRENYQVDVVFSNSKI